MSGNGFLRRRLSRISMGMERSTSFLWSGEGFTDAKENSRLRTGAGDTRCAWAAKVKAGRRFAAACAAAGAWKKLNMGGCLGCHGSQGQTAGGDFSVIVARGRAVNPEAAEPGEEGEIATLGVDRSNFLTREETRRLNRKAGRLLESIIRESSN